MQTTTYKVIQEKSQVGVQSLLQAIVQSNINIVPKLVQTCGHTEERERERERERRRMKVSTNTIMYAIACIRTHLFERSTVIHIRIREYRLV
jgi:hypothetical protein